MDDDEPIPLSLRYFVSYRVFQIMRQSVLIFNSGGGKGRKIGGGRPRKTMTNNDRYIVLQEKRDRNQTSGNIAQPDDRYPSLLWPHVCIKVKVAYSPIVLNAGHN